MTRQRFDAPRPGLLKQGMIRKAAVFQQCFQCARAAAKFEVTPEGLAKQYAGEENGRCYIVTEHVHGARTLAAYCRPDNLLRIDDVVELIYKAARALHCPKSCDSACQQKNWSRIR